MASAIIDGVATRYEVIGSGPPLFHAGANRGVLRTVLTDESRGECGAARDHRPHATSAAHYLEECLPRAEYWDMAVEQQTEAPTNARILEFLAKVSA